MSFSSKSPLRGRFFGQSFYKIGAERKIPGKAANYSRLFGSSELTPVKVPRYVGF